MTINNEFIPIIHEVRILEEQVQLPTVEEIKKYGLSIELKQALFNPNSKFNDNTNKVYCAFIDCPHSTPFNLNIDIEGCKWWMREGGYGIDLPGYWEESWTGNRYKREELWLSHIGHAQDADKLLNWERLYTVGTTGIKALEWRKFNSATKSLIEECIEAHKEHGAAINISRTIPSGTTGFTKWGIKIGAGIAATAAAPFIGPVGVMAVGAATWGASEAGKVLCDDKTVNSVLNITSDVGENVVRGNLISNSIEKMGGFIAGNIMTDSKEVGRLVGKEIGKWDGRMSLTLSAFEFLGHFSHLKEGKNYDSDCKVCAG